MAQDSAGNIWQFNYRKGLAFLSGHVRAIKEDTARQLAQEWCDMNSVLLAGGKVTPMILADEKTWKWRQKPEPIMETVDAVGATTAVNSK